MNCEIVGRTSGSLFNYQAWPTVAKAADGTLYVASSGHRLGHVCPFGKNDLYTSRDEGKTWLGPAVINDTYLDDRDSGLCLWGQSNMLVTWFNLPVEHYVARANDAQSHNDAMRTPLAQAAVELWQSLPEEEVRPGSYGRLSRDGGRTWSEPIKLPLTSPHGPVYTPQGKLLFVGKECWWGQGLEEKAIYAMESADEGYTWTTLAQLPCPEGFNWDQIHEAHGIQLPDGAMLAVMRVHDKSLPGVITLYYTRSTDGGKTWATPTRMTDLLGAPGHLMLHSSGAVILTYGRRVERRGQYVRISRDGGLTWSEDIAVSPEAPDWDHGYPSTVELSDGSLYTVYYHKWPGDDYNSILACRWNLPE